MAGVMNKILKIYSVALLALLTPFVAFAQAAITEIMYDPSGIDSGHEWIEVYNEGTSSIPLATWKIYEGNANHNIIAASGGSLLAPGTYAVIAQSAAKFESDHPDFFGVLFHSAFSLDNGGATLTLRDKSLKDINTVSYDSTWGGLGDGNSLQRVPGDTGQFVPRTPSPGAAMSVVVIAPRTITKAKPLSSAPVQKQKQPTGSMIGVTNVPNADVRASNDAGNMAIVGPQTAAVATSADESYWFFALAAVLLLAVAAIAGSRHFKKSEWDIIEESPEDV